MKYLFKYILIFTTVSFSCCNQPEQVKDEPYNAVITQIFKNISAREKSSLHFRAPYSLNRFSTNSNTLLDTSHQNVHITHINIDQPITFLNGTLGKSFIVKPGDSLVYEIKYFHKDKNHWGNIYTIVNHSGLILPDSYADTILYNNKKEKGYLPLLRNPNFSHLQLKEYLDDIFEINSMMAIAGKSAREYLEINPEFDTSKVTFDILKDYYIQCLFDYNSRWGSRFFKNKDQWETDYIKSAILRISKQLDSIITHKMFVYWYTLKSISKMFSEEAEASGFSNTYIQEHLKGFDSISTQYINLNLIEQNITKLRNRKPQMDSLMENITYPYFKTYLNNKLREYDSLGYSHLPEEVKKITIYDFNNKKIPFGELFKQPSGKYVMFDMCGTWCVPCMKAIKKYTETPQQLDTSKMIRPVWLFFENDSLSWKKTIQKYQLDPGNCYLILGKKALRTFERAYNWKGEFPHHFIFRDDGRLISDNAPELSDFDQIQGIIHRKGDI